MKKAIVTGATGFIGAAFVEYLCSQNIEVIAIGRKYLSEVKTSRRHQIKKAKYIRLNMDCIEDLNNELVKIEWDTTDDCVFFNLAWGGEYNLSDQNLNFQLKNIISSCKAFDVALQIGCEKFIQIGTMEELFALKYLELDHKVEQKKNRHIIYALSKIVARNALKIRSLDSNIDYIYVNHSHVMGIDDDKDSFLQTTLINLMKNKELKFSSGEQIFDVVSLTDCINAYYLVGKMGQAGQDYWVGSGKPRRLREYVEIMYSMYPSTEKMNFGSIGYSDVSVDIDDFSILLLHEHTGYTPKVSYEEQVKLLHKNLLL